MGGNEVNCLKSQTKYLLSVKFCYHECLALETCNVEETGIFRTKTKEEMCLGGGMELFMVRKSSFTTARVTDTWGSGGRADRRG